MHVDIVLCNYTIDSIHQCSIRRERRADLISVCSLTMSQLRSILSEEWHGSLWWNKIFKSNVNREEYIFSATSTWGANSGVSSITDFTIMWWRHLSTSRWPRIALWTDLPVIICTTAFSPYTTSWICLWVLYRPLVCQLPQANLWACGKYPA